MTAGRIRFIIEEVRITGVSPLDANRLVDRLQVELGRILPGLTRTKAGDPPRNVFREHVDAGSLTVEGRVEKSAAALARALTKAVLP